MEAIVVLKSGNELGGHCQDCQSGTSSFATIVRARTAVGTEQQVTPQQVMVSSSQILRRPSADPFPAKK
jgi:hypothetical protein